MLRFLWRFVAFLAEMNGYTPFFQALFKANLAIIVGGLSRSEWVGMLRFLQPQLSKKEKEIVRLSIQGFTEKEMSEDLQLSESAIKKRKKLLFQKLRVKNMSEAIICCTNKRLF